MISSHGILIYTLKQNRVKLNLIVFHFNNSIFICMFFYHFFLFFITYYATCLLTDYLDKNFKGSIEFHLNKFEAI